jgi:hypothetical protein
MTRTMGWIAGLAAVLAASAARAHDAFGDLGPFYAGVLHPLANPLQGALMVGVAALAAPRSAAGARAVLTGFVTAAVLASLFAAFGLIQAANQPTLAAVSIVVGIAATLPRRVLPSAALMLLGAGAGLIAGAAGDITEPVQPAPLAGAILGLGLLPLLLWGAIEALHQRVSPWAPAVIGSWVAALGVMLAALAI